MPAAGQVVGHYRLTAKLGEGGMGEVWRATDTRLNRDVAVKLLPAAFAGDVQRMARLAREAQMLASLNHPHIATLYGAEDNALVMELVDGPTLADRISTGALPLDEALPIATQIAQGLEYAHEKGMVHRDLKPANIKITPDGRVKILDFGLAKVVGEDAAASSSAEAATLTSPATRAGAIMGTAAYMSPEQARGRAVDRRTDIWAFGVVLYEMLTGQRPFAGPTVSDTLAAVLKEEPDLGPLPLAARRMVAACLRKDPAQRLRDACDALLLLEPSAADPARPLRPFGPWLAAALLIALAGGIFIGFRFLHRTGPPPVFITRTYADQMVFNPRYLPDGRSIVFTAAGSNAIPTVYALRPESPVPQAISAPGTVLLSVSASGELAVLTNAIWLAQSLYQGTLARMSPGGSPRAWMTGVREADWSPDGSQLALIRVVDDTHDRIEFPPGHALYESANYLSDIRFSHDGTHLAFAEHTPHRFDDRGSIRTVDLKGHLRTLTPDFWGIEGMIWSPDDREIEFSASTGASGGQASYQPMRVPASGGAFTVVSTPVDVMVSDVNRSGLWLALRSEAQFRVVVHTLHGDAREILWRNNESSGTLSPNGDEVAFCDQSAGNEYAVVLDHLDGSPPIQLGPGTPLTNSRAFSPDASWVAAVLPHQGRFAFYPVGPGEARRLDVSIDQFNFQGWYPDNLHVLLCGKSDRLAQGCYRFATTGGPPALVGSAGAVNGFAEPDGTTLLDDGSEAFAIRPDGARVAAHLDPKSFNGLFVGVAADGNIISRSMLSTGKFRLTTLNPLTGVLGPQADFEIPDQTGLHFLGLSSAIESHGQFAFTYDLVNWRRSVMEVTHLFP